MSADWWSLERLSEELHLKRQRWARVVSRSRNIVIKGREPGKYKRYLKN